MYRVTRQCACGRKYSFIKNYGEADDDVDPGKCPVCEDAEGDRFTPPSFR